MFRKVAIIGGGAAAATLASELLERRTPAPLELHWFAGSADPGRGVAYGTPSDRHLLNVRAASMGMFVSKPGGFLEFAQAANPAVKGSDFLPRRLYGDFLRARVHQALDNAGAFGHQMTLHPVCAEAVRRGPDGGYTITGGGVETAADVVVLAIGSLPPRPLAGVDDAALASGRYVTDPWPFLASAQPDERPLRVLVIGLGLTAVDVLLELSQRWPQAHFTALSRHGHLPEPHLPAASAPGDDGNELVETLRDDPNIRVWLHRLREAAQQADDWRTVVDGLRPHTQSLWRDLPAAERARFLRHARWAWERARHRMPPRVSADIAALESEGRLHRSRGRMHAVHLDLDGSLRVTRSHPGEPAADEHYDVVVQTVGLNTDTLRTEHALVRQLVDEGVVAADPLGLGFAADADGRLREPGSRQQGQLFAIGSMLRGALWESTAIPEIRKQAQSLATALTAAKG